jgi:hypothetical protein
VTELLATGARRRGARRPPEQVGCGAGAATYLSLVEQAKATLAIPLIASLHGTSRGGWVRLWTR